MTSLIINNGIPCGPASCRPVACRCRGVPVSLAACTLDDAERDSNETELKSEKTLNIKAFRESILHVRWTVEYDGTNLLTKAGSQ